MNDEEIRQTLGWEVVLVGAGGPRFPIQGEVIAMTDLVPGLRKAAADFADVAGTSLQSSHLVDRVERARAALRREAGPSAARRADEWVRVELAYPTDATALYMIAIESYVRMTKPRLELPFTDAQNAAVSSRLTEFFPVAAWDRIFGGDELMTDELMTKEPVVDLASAESWFRQTAERQGFRRFWSATARILDSQEVVDLIAWMEAQGEFRNGSLQHPQPDGSFHRH